MIKIPGTPRAADIQAELAALRRRAAELRALLRFAESRELAAKVHVPNSPVRDTAEDDCAVG